MYLFNLLIFLACLYGSQSWVQRYNPYIVRSWEHRKSAHRILELMRSYYEEGCARIKYINHMRFMYEESPYYETGYITGEIIERYRKVLEHVQKSVRFKFYLLFDVLKKIEYVQKLYFELYHLVRMLHEIPRKWRGVPEFANIESIAGPELLGRQDKKKKGPQDMKITVKKVKTQQGITIKEIPEELILAAQQRILEQESFQEKEKKRQKKKFKKMRQAFQKGLIKDYRGDRKPLAKNWPDDYGWDVNEDSW